MGENENYALLTKSADGLVGLDDAYPDYDGDCLCENHPGKYLKLRGLCNSSAIDTYYQLKNDLTDFRQLRFVGLHTFLEYDSGLDLWNLSVADEKVSGFSRISTASFLALGRHNWTIRGDRGCKEDINTDSYITELKMSGCKEGQFTCDSSQCVSMVQRCDQLPDCEDKSDEKRCDILVLEGGYNMNIPPIARGKHGEKIAVNVSTSIDVFKLVDIDEEDYSIHIQFQITMEWRENRATYQNLKFDNSLNALIQLDIEQLWLPKVIYENTDQKDTTRLGSNWEWETNVVVKREGNFTMGSLEIVDETYIFQGDQNSLVMTQTYTHEFQCQYNFVWYPFDTQVNVSNYLALAPDKSMTYYTRIISR